jgi:hypothetical protein
MLQSSRERIESELADDAVVLDVGGWAHPWPRADWVLDLLPYETRDLYGTPDPAAERFGHATWVVRDVCAREPWPWPEGFFDFVVCSHTLEDVRDPVWVCEEMERVGKAGYVEVPSRVEDQTYAIQGPWVGWGHHHWLCERAADGTLQFVFKHGVVAKPGNHLTPEARGTPGEDDRVLALWWEGELPARERIFTEPDELDAWLAEVVPAPAPRRARRRPWRRRPS